MKREFFVAAALSALFSTGSVTAFSADTAKAKQIERGRYMAITGGCNDCHTAGFAPNEGKIPEKDWLLGSGPLGYSGPWGTTYATNLRLLIVCEEPRLCGRTGPGLSAAGSGAEAAVRAVAVAAETVELSPAARCGARC